MRKNYKLNLSYEGTNYAGWQRQKNARTVQGEVERALSVITAQEVSVTGVSRTDAGVHARDYVANVFLDTDKELYPLQRGVNALLDRDIRLKDIAVCPDEFHARFDAKRKTYIYRIDNSSYGEVFTRNFTWRYPYQLDFDKMQQATSSFLGLHDFTAFMSKGGTSKTFEREIYRCDLEKSGNIIQMTVTGNGFLYNMVRIMAGTLVSIGRGDIEPERLKEIIASKERRQAGITAPPEGLVLERVEYSL